MRPESLVSAALRDWGRCSEKDLLATYGPAVLERVRAMLQVILDAYMRSDERNDDGGVAGVPYLLRRMQDGRIPPDDSPVGAFVAHARVVLSSKRSNYRRDHATREVHSEQAMKTAAQPRTPMVDADRFREWIDLLAERFPYAIGYLVEKRTLREIAREHGCSIPTAHRRVQSELQQLRLLAGEWGDFYGQF